MIKFRRDGVKVAEIKDDGKIEFDNKQEEKEYIKQETEVEKENKK